MTATISKQTRTCMICLERVLAEETRYIARYDQDICLVCFQAIDKAWS